MLEQVKVRVGNNSGYFQLNQSDILNLNKEQVQDLKTQGVLQYRHYSTFDVENMPEDRVYTIRLYKKGEKVFPKGFAAFRIGYIQVAHNYPPMTAKYLYERFTEHAKTPICITQMKMETNDHDTLMLQTFTTPKHTEEIPSSAKPTPMRYSEQDQKR